MPTPLPTLRPGDLLRDAEGSYYCVTRIDAPDWVHVERFGTKPQPPKYLDPSLFFGVDPKALVTDFGCQLVSRGEFTVGEWDGFEGGEEVKQRSTCSTGKSWRKSSSCPGIRV